jgi:ATP-dependent exoDNAse (exonuclease V) beta subunit
LKEARTAWDLDAFRTLLEKARLVETEWAAEDFDGEGRLRVGRFDLLIRQEQGWVVVDYKTSPPEGEVEGWIKTQTMRYRFQLRSYVQMLARVLGTPEEAVKGAILFTAIPRLVYL